jgi:hypothetical protein
MVLYTVKQLHPSIRKKHVTLALLQYLLGCVSEGITEVCSSENTNTAMQTHCCNAVPYRVLLRGIQLTLVQRF